MKRNTAIITSLLAIALLVSCNMPVTIVVNATPDANQVATNVAATLNAASTGGPVQQLPTITLTSNVTPTITLTPIPEPGSLNGSVTYPFGAIPRLTIAAYMISGGNYSYVINEAGTGYYSMDTPYLIPGQWLVVAYDSLGNSGGCTNPVTITSNNATTCNITDWVTAYPARKAGIPAP